MLCCTDQHEAQYYLLQMFKKAIVLVFPICLVMFEVHPRYIHIQGCSLQFHFLKHPLVLSVHPLFTSFKYLVVFIANDLQCFSFVCGVSLKVHESGPAASYYLSVQSCLVDCSGQWWKHWMLLSLIASVFIKFWYLC